MATCFAGMYGTVYRGGPNKKHKRLYLPSDRLNLKTRLAARALRWRMRCRKGGRGWRAGLDGASLPHEQHGQEVLVGQLARLALQAAFAPLQVLQCRSLAPADIARALLFGPHLRDLCRQRLDHASVLLR